MEKDKKQDHRDFKKKQKYFEFTKMYIKSNPIK